MDYDNESESDFRKSKEDTNKSSMKKTGSKKSGSSHQSIKNSNTGGTFIFGSASENEAEVSILSDGSSNNILGIRRLSVSSHDSVLENDESLKHTSTEKGSADGSQNLSVLVSSNSSDNNATVILNLPNDAMEKSSSADLANSVLQESKYKMWSKQSDDENKPIFLLDPSHINGSKDVQLILSRAPTTNAAVSDEQSTLVETSPDGSRPSQIMSSKANSVGQADNEKRRSSAKIRSSDGQSQNVIISERLSDYPPSNSPLISTKSPTFSQPANFESQGQVPALKSDDENVAESESSAKTIQYNTRVKTGFLENVISLLAGNNASATPKNPTNSLSPNKSYSDEKRDTRNKSKLSSSSQLIKKPSTHHHTMQSGFTDQTKRIPTQASSNHSNIAPRFFKDSDTRKEISKSFDHSNGANRNTSNVTTKSAGEGPVRDIPRPQFGETKLMVFTRPSSHEKSDKYSSTIITTPLQNAYDIYEPDIIRDPNPPRSSEEIDTLTIKATNDKELIIPALDNEDGSASSLSDRFNSSNEKSFPDCQDMKTLVPSRRTLENLYRACTRLPKPDTKAVRSIKIRRANSETELPTMALVVAILTVVSLAIAALPSVYEPSCHDEMEAEDIIYPVEAVHGKSWSLLPALTTLTSIVALYAGYEYRRRQRIEKANEWKNRLRGIVKILGAASVICFLLLAGSKLRPPFTELKDHDDKPKANMSKSISKRLSVISKWSWIFLMTTMVTSIIKKSATANKANTSPPIGLAAYMTDANKPNGGGLVTPKRLV